MDQAESKKHNDASPNLSDDILMIPISSNIDSLNVSAAFSAVIFELVRQRNY